MSSPYPDAVGPSSSQEMKEVNREEDTEQDMEVKEKKEEGYRGKVDTDTGFVVPTKMDLENTIKDENLKKGVFQIIPSGSPEEKKANPSAIIWRTFFVLLRILCFLTSWYVLLILLPMCHHDMVTKRVTSKEAQRWRNSVALLKTFEANSSNPSAPPSYGILEYFWCDNGRVVDQYSFPDPAWQNTTRGNVTAVDCFPLRNAHEEFCYEWFFSWRAPDMNDEEFSLSWLKRDSKKGSSEYRAWVWQCFAHSMWVGMFLALFVSRSRFVLRNALWGQTASETIDKDRSCRWGLKFRTWDHGDADNPPSILATKDWKLPDDMVCEDISQPLQEWPRSRLIRFSVRYRFFFADQESLDRYLEDFLVFYQAQVAVPSTASFDVIVHSQEVGSPDGGRLLRRGPRPYIRKKGIGKDALLGRDFKPWVEIDEEARKKDVAEKNALWFYAFPLRAWVYNLSILLRFDILMSFFLQLSSEDYEVELIKVFAMKKKKEGVASPATAGGGVGIWADEDDDGTELEGRQATSFFAGLD